VPMAKVLSISSQVVYGHVGNSAAAFVLQRMGHDVLAVPTIVLSNRPGYEAISGERTDPQKLNAMLEAVLENGWLADVDAVLTGYVPTVGHAGFCASWIAKIKTFNPNATYLCDPIIGDEPGGIYVDKAAANAVRDLLLPLADIVTPNAFELGWLSGRAISDAASAVSAVLALDRPAVVVTSAPAASGMIANILVEGRKIAATASPRRMVKAHGTGDFFASIFLAHRLKGYTAIAALRASVAAIDLVLDRSETRSELALIETQGKWAAAEPPLAPLLPLPAEAATS
jgi:pyridoxine kinase